MSNDPLITILDAALAQAADSLALADAIHKTLVTLNIQETPWRSTFSKY